MAQTTPNLGLTVWNLRTDPYDSGQLAQNFIAIDQHDHSNGKGAPIDATNAILNGSITGAKLASPAVGTGNIADYAVTSNKLANNSVTTSTITDLNVTGTKIADGTITRSKLTSIYTSTVPVSPTSGDEIYYDTGSSGPVWHLRHNGSRWDFLGGAPSSSYVNGSVQILANDDGGTSPDYPINTGTGGTTLPSLALKKGSYRINYSALMNFIYVSVSTAQMVLYLYNTNAVTNTTSPVASIVLSPPLGGDTQLQTTLAQSFTYTATSDTSLYMYAKNYNRQTGTLVTRPSVSRSSITATPIYLT